MRLTTDQILTAEGFDAFVAAVEAKRQEQHKRAAHYVELKRIVDEKIDRLRDLRLAHDQAVLAALKHIGALTERELYSLINTNMFSPISVDSVIQGLIDQGFPIVKQKIARYEPASTGYSEKLRDGYCLND